MNYPKEFELHIEEAVEYFILCDECEFAETDRSSLKSEVARQAHDLGFQVIDGRILCKECVHADCEDHPCADCGSAAIDAAMDRADNEAMAQTCAVQRSGGREVWTDMSDKGKGY